MAPDPRAVARSLAARAPALRTGIRAAAALRDLPALLRLGLLDREFYEAQAGRGFGSERAAAVHYLLHGRLQGFSPHPFYEPEYLAGPAPARWKGRREPLLAALRAGDPGPTSPLFDPAEHGGPPGAALPPDAPLPVPPTWTRAVPTAGQARAVLLEAARRDARFRALRRTRRSAEWDEARERAFLAGRTPPPATGAPLVTVVMPVRNRPEAVRAAIASVRAQTLADWELVVVDDGSTDATPAVLDAEAAADPRVRVLHREAAGVCAARNAGIAAGSAPLVAFLDSDNAWVPYFLEVMASWLTETGGRAAHAVVDSGEPGPRRYLAYEGGLEDLLVLNHVDLNTLVVDRAVLTRIGGFDESLRRWVDHDLAIRIARVTPIRLAPFVGVHYDDAGTADGRDADRITTRESDHWQFAVLGHAHVDWPAVEAGLPGRVPGRVTISMPVYEDWTMTVRAVEAVLAAGGDVEVLVVDNGSRRAVGAILAAAFLGEPRVRILPQPRNLHFATGSNLGLAHGTGDVVVFLNNDTVATHGWLGPVLDLLAEPGVLGVQPLLLYPDGTIQSAGTAFPGDDGLPAALLTGHPPEDARRAAPIRLPVVTAAALAMRVPDAVALRGFDPLYVNGFEDVDLCLRAGLELRGEGAGGGLFAVATDAVVVHDESRTPGRGRRIRENRRLFLERWAGRLPGSDYGVLERAGLRVARFEAETPGAADDATSVRRAVLETIPRTTAAGEPVLRWALRGAAADLVEALTALGQDVAVDRPESTSRPSAALDDVVVGGPALPGRIALERPPGDSATAARELLDRALAGRGAPVTPPPMSEGSGHRY